MDFENPLESTKKLLLLKAEESKLDLIACLSRISGRLLGSILIVLVLTLVLAATAIAGVLLLGEWLGSYAIGTLIVAGVLLLLLLLLICFRKKLFLNSSVRFFIRLFYGKQ